MNWLGLLGVSLLAAGMVMLLRQMFAPAASLLTLAFGAMMLSAMLPPLREYVSSIGAFLGSMSLGGEYGAVMLKTIGIVLLTQLTGEACQELGAPGIARYVQLCGRIALLGISMPILMSITQMAVDVLR